MNPPIVDYLEVLPNADNLRRLKQKNKDSIKIPEHLHKALNSDANADTASDGSPASAAEIEEALRIDAGLNGTELVPNPLHPANRGGAVPEDDFEERINRGIRDTAREHRRCGGRQIEEVGPEDY
jgi:hypothetical protein